MERESLETRKAATAVEEAACAHLEWEETNTQLQEVVTDIEDNDLEDSFDANDDVEALDAENTGDLQSPSEFDMGGSPCHIWQPL